MTKTIKIENGNSSRVDLSRETSPAVSADVSADVRYAATPAGLGGEAGGGGDVNFGVRMTRSQRFRTGFVQTLHVILGLFMLVLKVASIYLLIPAALLSFPVCFALDVMAFLPFSPIPPFFKFMNHQRKTFIDSWNYHHPQNPKVFHQVNSFTSLVAKPTAVYAFRLVTGWRSAREKLAADEIFQKTTIYKGD